MATAAGGEPADVRLTEMDLKRILRQGNRPGTSLLPLKCISILNTGQRCTETV